MKSMSDLILVFLLYLSVYFSFSRISLLGMDVLLSGKHLSLIKPNQRYDRFTFLCHCFRPSIVIPVLTHSLLPKTLPSSYSKSLQVVTQVAPRRLASTVASAGTQIVTRWLRLQRNQILRLAPKTFCATQESISNFQSFVRMLKGYGFRKLSNESKGDGSVSFHHDLFRRGRPDLLEHITRTKGATTKSRHQEEKKEERPSSVGMMLDNMQLQLKTLSGKLDLLISLVSAKDFSLGHHYCRPQACSMCIARF